MVDNPCGKFVGDLVIPIVGDSIRIVGDLNESLVEYCRTIKHSIISGGFNTLLKHSD